jgi:hypothetical protein
MGTPQDGQACDQDSSRPAGIGDNDGHIARSAPAITGRTSPIRGHAVVTDTNPHRSRTTGTYILSVGERAGALGDCVASAPVVDAHASSGFGSLRSRAVRGTTDRSQTHLWLRFDT